MTLTSLFMLSNVSRHRVFFCNERHFLYYTEERLSKTTVWLQRNKGRQEFWSSLLHLDTEEHIQKRILSCSHWEAKKWMAEGTHTENGDQLLDCESIHTLRNSTLHLGTDQQNTECLVLLNRTEKSDVSSYYSMTYSVLVQNDIFRLSTKSEIFLVGIDQCIPFLTLSCDQDGMNNQRLKLHSLCLLFNHDLGGLNSHRTLLYWRAQTCALWAYTLAWRIAANWVCWQLNLVRSDRYPWAQTFHKKCTSLPYGTVL